MILQLGKRSVGQPLISLFSTNFPSSPPPPTPSLALGSTRRWPLPARRSPLAAPAIHQFLLPRVLELTYTAWDLESFGKDCGYDGPPFRWDDARRRLLRCELDAAFFHLYLPSDKDGGWIPARKSDGAVQDEAPEDLAILKAHFPTPRHAVDYIMDSFPIVKRRDEAAHGVYRTKLLILEIYDAMQTAIRAGASYQTRLAPPPADPSNAHPPKK